MTASAETPPLLMLGAPPRGGNHLLRGLLDHHPQLLLPPDEDYFVRAFGSFGNDPRKFYATEPYFQFGEPRISGVTFEFNVGE